MASEPAELDGVVAPDHHRVLFENDRVRVIETINSEQPRTRLSSGDAVADEATA